MTHAQAVALVRGKNNRRSRKVANNTYARILDDGAVAFQLHDTDVVIIHQNDTATLNTGGWYTYTTRARMNDYAPVYVDGKCTTRSWDHGEWSVRPKHGEWRIPVPFSDGMIVNQYMFV